MQVSVPLHGNSVFVSQWKFSFGSEVELDMSSILSGNRTKRIEVLLILFFTVKKMNDQYFEIFSPTNSLILTPWTNMIFANRKRNTTVIANTPILRTKTSNILGSKQIFYSEKITIIKNDNILNTIYGCWTRFF